MAEVTDPALNGQFEQIRDESTAGANTKLRVYNAFKNSYDTLKALIGLKANSADVTTALEGKLGVNESGDYTLFIPHEGGRSKAIAFQGLTDKHTIDAESNGEDDNTNLVITIGDNDADNLIIRQVNSVGTSEIIAKFNRLGIQFLKPLTDAAGNPIDSSGKADKDLSINTQTASYTLALTDRGGMVRMNVASANTLTVPPNSAVAFPVGTQIVLTQAGAGQATIVAGSGVTINASGAKMKLTGQWSGATLIQVSANVWTLMGDLSA